MNKHLYAYLDQWGKDNGIGFRVDHYDDYHMLFVREYIDGVVRTVRVKYPHRGERYALNAYAIDDKIAYFINLFEFFKRVIPMQPCDELGYVA